MSLLFTSFLLAATVTVQQTATISGRIVDQDNLKPIADAVVRVQGTELNTISDVAGNFRLRDVPQGERILVVQHLAYGEHADTVVVAGDVRLEVRVSRQAIQLAPLLIEAPTELEIRRRAAGHSFNEIVREQIDAAAEKGQNLADLLRDGLISLRVSAERRGAYCVEFRQGGMGLGQIGVRATCKSIAVFMDGVRVAAASNLYSSLPLRSIERIEALGPAEAGTQYGISGGWGVLLIETRQGSAGRQRPERRTVLISGFDWSQEVQPYRWRRVAGSSIVGTAAGLGLGLLVADQCFRFDQGIHGLRSKCDAFSTVGSGFAVLALPAVAGSFAAQWGGTTDRSRGRIVPSALLGTLTVASGYMLLVHANSNDSAAAQTAGTLVLTVATPLVTTLADRVFRRLR